MDTTSPDAHHNPFEVLELGATATARDVTRQKDKLLGMLELGLDRAKQYAASVGTKERSPDLVRSAAQELERPRSRLAWELWLKPSDEQVDADPDAAAMRTALILHHELLREAAHGIAFGVDELDELGNAWDAVIDSPGLYDRVAERATELGIEGDEAEVFDGLREEIREQMLTMFERGPTLDLDMISSEIASDVAHTFADRKVELLELACSRIDANPNGGQIQRHQKWNGLVREYAATVNGRGMYLRAAAFQAVNAGMGDVASDLFNNNIDHSLALSMFAWLRDEAVQVGDDGAVELHRKNATIVQQRITHDNAALEAASYNVSDSSNNGLEWGAGRVLMICIGIILAALRLGKGCDSPSSSSYSPPPPSFRDYRQDRIPDLEELIRLERALESGKTPAPEELIRLERALESGKTPAPN